MNFKIRACTGVKNHYYKDLYFDEIYLYILSKFLINN